MMQLFFAALAHNLRANVKQKNQSVFLSIHLLLRSCFFLPLATAISLLSAFSSFDRVETDAPQFLQFLFVNLTIIRGQMSRGYVSNPVGKVEAQLKRSN